MILDEYKRLEKELDSINKTYEELKKKKTEYVGDTYKDYRTGHSTIKMFGGFGYDSITYSKLLKYKDKKSKLEIKQQEMLNEVEIFIKNINSPYIKEICRYRYIVGLSFKEIADKMDNNEKNVREAIYKFKKNFKKVV